MVVLEFKNIKEEEWVKASITMWKILISPVLKVCREMSQNVWDEYLELYLKATFILVPRYY